jgi:hypothetical protein
MQAVMRTLERLGILLACVYVAWLVFIDPSYLAFNDDEPLPMATLAVSIAATLSGAACAAYSAWTK